MDEKKRNALRIHFGLFLAEALCTSAFVLEISRALSGNTLSWAYVVEWPVLGTYAAYMWRKLLKDGEFHASRSTPPNDLEDARLVEWNDYLTRVHSRDQSDQDDAQ